MSELIQAGTTILKFRLVAGIIMSILGAVLILGVWIYMFKAGREKRKEFNEFELFARSFEQRRREMGDIRDSIRRGQPDRGRGRGEDV